MPMWTTKNKRPKKEHLTEEETKEKALNLLEYRAHSRKELFDKLRRFSDTDTVNGVLDMLEEAGLIDDETFAFQFAHDAMELKMFGPVRVKRELALRGIDGDTAENAIWAAEKETGSAEERLAELLERKYKNMLSDEKNISRIIAKLWVI